MTEDVREEEQPRDESVDALEQKLLDAVRALNRKNKMVEEYLDNLSRSGEKPPAQPEPPKS